jgi:hypothetical protein
VRREDADRLAVLRAKRDAIYELQQEMLVLFCQFDRACDRLEREQAEAEESNGLLRQARQWLGGGVREVA